MCIMMGDDRSEPRDLIRITSHMSVCRILSSPFVGGLFSMHGVLIDLFTTTMKGSCVFP